MASPFQPQPATAMSLYLMVAIFPEVAEYALRHQHEILEAYREGMIQ